MRGVSFLSNLFFLNNGCRGVSKYDGLFLETLEVSFKNRKKNNLTYIKWCFIYKSNLFPSIHLNLSNNGVRKIMITLLALRPIVCLGRINGLSFYYRLP